MEDSERRLDLDVAKGIGILMVVWAHADGPFSNYINQFHMPFFFFISGLLYKNTNISVKEYIRKKVKSLLYPFWKWNILFFPIFFILYYWKDWSISEGLRWIIEIILTLQKVPFLGATWFLPALFWISVSTHMLVGICRKVRCSEWIILGGTSVVLCILGFYITLPYKLSRNLICFLFYSLGYLYNKYISYRIKENSKDIFACIGMVVFLLIANVNIVAMGGNEYKYKMAFIIGAVGAIAFVLRLSKWLMENNRLKNFTLHLVYLGKNTVDIVIWHFLTFRFAILIQICIWREPLKAIVAFPTYDASGFWWIVYVLFGIYGSLLWAYVLKNNSLNKQRRKNIELGLDK